jgi:hypothetical protein
MPQRLKHFAGGKRRTHRSYYATGREAGRNAWGRILGEGRGVNGDQCAGAAFYPRA